MTRIASYLSPGGVAVIEVPNDFSDLHSTIFGDTSKEELPIFVPPVHLHYFTTKTLPELGRRNGFSVIDCFGDYPIDHLLMEEAFNYYKDRRLGSSAHSLRRKFFYASGVDVDARPGLFRSIFMADWQRFASWCDSESHFQPMMIIRAAVHPYAGRGEIGSDSKPT
jgi:hypothetical protein